MSYGHTWLALQRLSLIDEITNLPWLAFLVRGQALFDIVNQISQHIVSNDIISVISFSTWRSH